MIRLRRWLIRLYPQAWRERYEAEFVALLEESPTTLLDTLDLTLGALDAHLDPQTGGERLVALGRLRAATVVIQCSYAGFVMAGLGFRKMTEYEDFVAVARAHAEVGLAFDAVVAGSAVALLAILAGGLPIVFSAAKRAIVARDRDTLLLFAVPPLAASVFVAYTLALVRVVYPAMGPLKVHDTLNLAVFVSLVGALLIAVVASVVAAAVVVARSGIEERSFRFAVACGAVATAAMGVMLAGTIVWGLGLQVDAPSLFNGNDGIVGTSTALNWLGIVAVMGVSTLFAGAAVVRGLKPGAAVYPAGGVEE